MRLTLGTILIVVSQFSFSQAIDWASFAGGSAGSGEQANAIAVSPAGHVYVAASVNSSDFPDAMNSLAGGTDALLIKMDTLGNHIWTRYIGGSLTDNLLDMSIINDSLIVLVGNTVSTDFPVTGDAYQSTLAGADDGYIFVCDSAGAMVYSSYFGGTLSETAYGVHVDGDQIYVCGNTSSTDLPTASAYQPTNAGGIDGYLTSWDWASGYSLDWSTYAGGALTDYARKITVDDAGSIYIAGRTQSFSLDLTAGSFQPTNAGGSYDGYVQKYATDGTLQWSTFYGGSDDDRCRDIDTDGGAVYITGNTFSDDFPVTAGAYQTTIGSVAQVDGFVAKLDTSGAQVWSTYYGTAAIDNFHRITIDPNANVSVCGYTTSFSFDVTSDAAQPTMMGVYDGVVARLDSSGAQLYSSYLGGDNIDYLFGITDFFGDVYVAGSTRSTDYPVTAGAYQTTHGGGTEDVSIVRLGFDLECVLLSEVSGVNPSCYGDSDGTGTLTVTFGESPYSYEWDAAAAFQTTATASGLSDGSYTVVVTDANGCTDTQTVVLVEPDTMIATIISSSPDDGTCSGVTGVSVAGGTPAYSFEWDAGGDYQTTAVASGLCAGEACVTVTDANGCTADVCTIIESIAELEEADFEFQVYPNPMAEDLFINAEVNSSYQLYSISMALIQDGQLSNGQNKIDVSGLPSGAYFLKYFGSEVKVIKLIKR